jgi:hypothetical protein
MRSNSAMRTFFLLRVIKTRKGPLGVSLMILLPATGHRWVHLVLASGLDERTQMSFKIVPLSAPYSVALAGELDGDLRDCECR